LLHYLLLQSLSTESVESTPIDASRPSGKQDYNKNHRLRRRK